jgi:ABC-type transport system substrate-binding protein
MRTAKGLLFLFLALLLSGGVPAQELISNVPRKETLIVENPEGTIKNAGWFNIWSINAGGQSTGLHQLAMDTFWYIDPNRGVDGVWDNSLASDKPIYNSDFTEMTVKLRKGIYWSDGVEFTAADVVYTVETHLNTKGLRWSAPIQVNVAAISAPDPYTAVFRLKKPNLPAVGQPAEGAPADSGRTTRIHEPMANRCSGKPCRPGESAKTPPAAGCSRSISGLSPICAELTKRRSNSRPPKAGQVGRDTGRSRRAVSLPSLS